MQTRQPTQLQPPSEEIDAEEEGIGSRWFDPDEEAAKQAPNTQPKRSAPPAH